VTLAEVQARFHAAATGGDRGAGEPAGLAAGSADLPAAARLRIYSDMWRVRQLAALREDFPALAALAGDGFDALAGAYLAAFPSDHFDLARLGRRLPRHLRADPGRGRPDAGDLAALEWARLAVFFEADAESAPARTLAGLDPPRFAAARLRLVPALRVLRLRHDVAPLWGALVRGEDPPLAAPGTAHLAVWRRGFDVFHAPLPAEEALALAAARRGRAIADVLAVFAGARDPVSAAFSAVESWFAEGWVAAVEGAPAPRRHAR
jgi:hypothetical protein